MGVFDGTCESDDGQSSDRMRLGESGAPPFDFVWTNPAAGSYAPTARAI